MDFNTLIFVGFFAAATALNYLFPRVARPWFLLLASYVFYLYKPENARLVFVLITLTLVTYLCGLVIEASHKPAVRRAFLLLGILAGCGFLFFFKYFEFFTGKALDLMAPLGLSYFTFQSMGYVIDVYQKVCPAQKNPVKYALFVSFFPCIFTGPIERAGHLMPQFDAPARFDYDRVAGGVFRMLWGYCKKMVLADTIGGFVKSVYSLPEGMPGPYLLLASLLFSYQIYLDFSGCCDIAIGGAQALGFTLTENFNRPFGAHSYTELWNRWHMSLTGWFRDYIFTPLSFANRGLPGFWGKLQGWFNVFIIFPISGLWHGASWGYVIWGVFNGLFMVIGKATARRRRKLNKKNPLYKNALLRTAIQRTIVYLLFTFCIVFFAADLYGGSAGAVLGGIFGGWDMGVSAFWNGLAGKGLDIAAIAVLVIGGVLVAAVESRGLVSDWIRRQRFFVRWPLYWLLALALLTFGVFGQSAFIYQQY